MGNEEGSVITTAVQNSPLTKKGTTKQAIRGLFMQHSAGPRSPQRRGATQQTEQRPVSRPSGQALTACRRGGSGSSSSSSSGGERQHPARIGQRGGGGAKPNVGGARDRFGRRRVVVLADDGGLAAQCPRHGRLARLEGVHHVHLQEDTATAELGAAEG